MPEAIVLNPTRCAICGTFENSVEVYPANFQIEDLNSQVFSARRLPDGVHYRIVRCKECGLVRSDPTVDEAVLHTLYSSSTFDYGDEVGNLKRTYGRYLSKLAQRQGRRGSLLEIGCGNGFILEEALDQGYPNVRGVEPGRAVAESATPRLQGKITVDLMRAGLFPPESFDCVCLFQVFDHISDPGSLLDVCKEVLKPGGLILCLNHNVESISARLLGERSPIIDIEHTYLYSPGTMIRMLERHGFKTLESGSVWNTYSVAYLTRLLPLPKNAKLKLSQNRLLKQLRLTVPLGNLFAIASR